MKKKVLEVFAGSRSIGNKAEELGMEVFSVDWTIFLLKTICSYAP